MKVVVHLHTILQLQSPNGPIRRLEMDLPPESTLQMILDAIHLPLKPDDVLFVINTQTADPTQLLHEGDEVHLIPALSGGGLF